MIHKAKIVTFTSRKGGVGKTVCTTLLARYLAEVEGKQVLIVDLDASCGITSIFYDQPLKEDQISIGELLQLAADNRDIRDAFAEAMIPTTVEENRLWEDSGGHIYLLPAKENLDQQICRSRPALLREVLSSLDLGQDHIILVDTGPEQTNVQMGIAAAEVVFLPIIFSRQDVYPAVDTLRAIIQEQKATGNATLGGLVINDFGETQWEREYQQNFQRLFQTFRGNAGLISTSSQIFIQLKRSKIIKRGKYLDWSFRDAFFETARAMAAAVHADNGMRIGIR